MNVANSSPTSQTPGCEHRLFGRTDGASRGLDLQVFCTYVERHCGKKERSLLNHAQGGTTVDNILPVLRLFKNLEHILEHRLVLVEPFVESPRFVSCLFV